MKVCTVDHDYPPGHVPANTSYLLPTRELAEDYQSKHGGTVHEREVADDSEEAAVMREAYPGHFELLPAAEQTRIVDAVMAHMEPALAAMPLGTIENVKLDPELQVITGTVMLPFSVDGEDATE